jgi:hypothetical protein
VSGLEDRGVPNSFDHDLQISGDIGAGPIGPLPAAVPEPSSLALIAARAG